MRRVILILAVLTIAASGGTDEIAFEVGMLHDFSGSGLATFAGDFNGDGAIDIGVSNGDTGQITLHINQGDGTLVARDLPAATWAFDRPHVADLDGDGKDDLVMAGVRPGGLTAIGMFISTKTDEFLQEWIEEDVWYLLPPVDLNNNDRPDLVGVGLKETGFKTYSNIRAPDFVAQDRFTIEGLDGYPGFADLDQDHRPEMIWEIDGRLVSSRNLGSGEFADPVTIEKRFPRQMALTDIDGDQHIDIVGFKSQPTIGVGAIPTGLHILRGRGDGTFLPIEHQAIAAPDQTGGGEAIWALDFDDDGDVDLATHGGRNRLTLLPNPGDGQFDKATEFVFLGDDEPRIPIHVVAGNADGVEGTDLVVVLWSGVVRFLVPSVVPPPVITETSPDIVMEGGTETVTIRGTGFHPDCTLSLDDDLTLESMTFVDSGHLTATITFPLVDINEPTGVHRDLAVVSPSGPSARAERAIHVQPEIDAVFQIQKGKLAVPTNELGKAKLKMSGTIDSEGLDRLFASVGAEHLTLLWGEPDAHIKGHTVALDAGNVRVNRKSTKLTYRDPKQGIRFTLRRKSKKKQFQFSVKWNGWSTGSGRVFLAFEMGDVKAYGETRWPRAGDDLYRSPK